ncbi:ferredoxin [Actinokineospora sp.]|uniref:ferredoxin n=1 Tax=Actinokineospora sp. TaxID=1872133 RepID=UPI0040382FE6
MTWKLEVNASRCMASGVCVATAPEHFELAGLSATVKSAEIEPNEDVLDAAESCPTLAISIRDGDKELVV